MQRGRPKSVIAERRVRLYGKALRHYAKVAGEPATSDAVIRAAWERAERRYPGVPRNVLLEHCATLGLPHLRPGRPRRDLLQQAAVLLGDRPSTDPVVFVATYRERLALYEGEGRSVVESFVVALLEADAYGTGIASESTDLEADVRLTLAWTVATLLYPDTVPHVVRLMCREQGVPVPPVGKVRQRILAEVLPAPILDYRENFSESTTIRRALEQMADMDDVGRTRFVAAMHRRWTEQSQEGTARRRLYHGKVLPFDSGSSGVRRGNAGGRRSIDRGVAFDALNGGLAGERR